MKRVLHKKQREIWDKEHKNPLVLLQMDSHEPSSGVVLFYHWLKEHDSLANATAVEMACGKGRNVIWLASQKIDATGLDFSVNAINEAKKRVPDELKAKSHFILHDVTLPWPFKTSHFDIGIDCFGSTDIESAQKRSQAVKEMINTIKPNGVLFVYALSTDDGFHQKMIRENPVAEKGAFIHPNSGKFEKAFLRDELIQLYKGLRLVEEKRIEKIATFYGKKYQCYHHWMIFQKCA